MLDEDLLKFISSGGAIVNNNHTITSSDLAEECEVPSFEEVVSTIENVNLYIPTTTQPPPSPEIEFKEELKVIPQPTVHHQQKKHHGNGDFNLEVFNSLNENFYKIVLCGTIPLSSLAKYQVNYQFEYNDYDYYDSENFVNFLNSLNLSPNVLKERATRVKKKMREAFSK